MRFFSLSAVILLLLAQPIVFALPCQYAVNGTNFTTVQNLYERGTDRFVTDSLEIRNISTSDTYGSFEVYNAYDVPISIILTFDYGFAVFAGPRQRITENVNMTILEKGSQKIQIGPNKTIWARFAFYNETMRYVFLDNNETYQKYETAGVTYERCKTCLGEPCLDDGSPCSANAECGGGYCVRNRCNFEHVCYASNCGCSSDEIQCPDNIMCAPRNALELGAEPICSHFECKTGHVNSSTGACAKSPETLEAEEKARIDDANARKEQLTLFILAAMAVAVLFYLVLEFQRRKKESELEKKERKRSGQ